MVNRGSEWRLWNLHMHSAYSKETRTKMSVKEIFDKLIEKFRCFQLQIILMWMHWMIFGIYTKIREMKKAYIKIRLILFLE